jgi:nucleoside-diphosphate-sugar epimerase
MGRLHLERVLITGATGTLGYNTVRRLSEAEPDTRIRVHMRTLDEVLFSDLPNVEVECVDLTDVSRMSQLVREFKPNAIIHNAASGVRPSMIGWFEQIRINVPSTIDLFQVANEIADCHFIHISTGLVYSSRDRPCREGDPIDTLHPYGASKAAADCLLRSGAEHLKGHLTVVRPFSFTGLHDGGERFFPSLLRAASQGKPFPMSAGTQLRDFCAVQDIADGIILMLQEGNLPGRDVFNLGSGQSVSLRGIVSSVCRQLGIDVELQLGAKPFHPYEPMSLVADIHLARSIGWRPRINLAYAVWELARSRHPELKVEKPAQFRLDL